MASTVPIRDDVNLSGTGQLAADIILHAASTRKISAAVLQIDDSLD